MPILLQARNPMVLDVEDVIEGLADNKLDPCDLDSLEENAYLLRGLYNNRQFLSRFIVSELESDLKFQNAHNLYSAQVIMLSDMARDYFIRANIWPSAQDKVLSRNGTNPFFYGSPHDHNFNFLTIGYYGPGYRSRYYEYDRDNVIGYPGEAVDLSFVGEWELSQGKMQLYRSGVDVHEQLMPSSLSVSLNIMENHPRRNYSNQYRFDVNSGKIISTLNFTPDESLFTLLAVLDGNSYNYLEHLATCHPSDRVKLSALSAMASSTPCFSEAKTIYEKGIVTNSDFLVKHCQALLRKAEKCEEWIAG